MGSKKFQLGVGRQQTHAGGGAPGPRAETGSHSADQLLIGQNLRLVTGQVKMRGSL